MNSLFRHVKSTLPRTHAHMHTTAKKFKSYLDVVNDVIEVETRIAQITPSVESKEYISIADLNTLAPFVCTYLSINIAHKNSSLNNVTNSKY